MNSMLKAMVENYKARMDYHKQDYERGCYESVEEFREGVNNEYRNMLDMLHGMARYEGISWEDYNKLSNECLEYALDIHRTTQN